MGELQVLASALVPASWPAVLVPAEGVVEWRRLQRSLRDLAPLLPVCAADPAAWHSPAWSPRTAEAVEWCQGCPVRAECLEYALAAGEREGVWGGTTPAERGAAQAAAPVFEPSQQADRGC